MRKIIVYVLIGFLLAGMFAGCGKKPDEAGYQVQVYYLSREETKVEMHTRSLRGSTVEERLQELIRCLSENPEKLEYKAPLSMGFQVLDVTLEDGKVLLCVDADYKHMSVTTEVLVRAALTRTLTQLEEVHYVGINVDGDPLYDCLGNTVGWMSADQFIDNDGSEINTYELAKIKLYFADESGTKLIAAYREKYYATSTPLERFVVEELLSGPSGQVPGLYPTVNPATKIISIMTKDGICYVNLDAGFLTGTNNVTMDCTIYSIVNSLVELNNINKVQILINGEVPSVFTTSTFERNLDIVITLEK